MSFLTAPNVPIISLDFATEYAIIEFGLAGPKTNMM